jgi:ubiquinone/menaquinone biosynthesis C-methylase UbiE/DNA-binding transcriptional ArsR family regulator
MALSLIDLLDGLRAAAEPTRLRLLAICAEGELTVSEITRILGQSQPRVSRHLRLLLSAGLLISFRERHWVYYRTPAKGPAAQLVHRLLELLPRDDETLGLDRTRLEQVQAERARAAADYLRFNAEDWAQLREAQVNTAQINRTILAELGGEPIGDLLDIGTGAGHLLKLLGKDAESAIGVDISTQMLLVARSNLHAAGLKEVMVRHGDMYHLPFADGSFDTVTLDQVLYQAENPAAVVAEAARLLRPGGRVLVVDYGRGNETKRSSIDPRTSQIGMSEDALAEWFEHAGLQAGPVRRLPGESLTVLVTAGLRRARTHAAA